MKKSVMLLILVFMIGLNEANATIVCDNSQSVSPGNTIKINCTISSVKTIIFDTDSPKIYSFDILNITKTGALNFISRQTHGVTGTGGGASGGNGGSGANGGSSGYGGGPGASNYLIEGGFALNYYECSPSGTGEGGCPGRKGQNITLKSNFAFIDGTISVNGNNGFPGKDGGGDPGYSGDKGVPGKGGGGGGGGGYLLIEVLYAIGGNGSINALGGIGGGGGKGGDDHDNIGCGEPAGGGGGGGGGKGGYIKIIANSKTIDYNLKFNVNGGNGGNGGKGGSASENGCSNAQPGSSGNTGASGTYDVSGILSNLENYIYPLSCNDQINNDLINGMDMQDSSCRSSCGAGWTDLSNTFSLIYPYSWFSRSDGYDSCCGDDNYILNGDFEY